VICIPILELEKVVKRFGEVTALNGLSLHLDAGEALGLVGPNGAGKTTTIRVSLGILRRDSGRVTLFGEDPWIRPEVRRRVGVVHERPAFVEGMRVVDWMEKVCSIYGVDVSSARRVLELVELWSVRRRRIKALSAGMRQRLALAQALVHDPELLILDEPFTNLDPPTRTRFIEVLSRVKRERGLALLITSHTLSDVLSLSSRIAVISRGRIVFRGSPEDVERALGASIVRVRCSNPRALSEGLTGIEGVRRVEVVDEQTLVLEVDSSKRASILRILAAVSEERGVSVFDVETRAPEIEELIRRSLGGG